MIEMIRIHQMMLTWLRILGFAIIFDDIWLVGLDKLESQW